jgi:cytochrome b561
LPLLSDRNAIILEGTSHQGLTGRGLEEIMKQVSRYDPWLVTLHWLLAALIIIMLVVAFFVLGRLPTANPRTLELLIWHMAGGTLILVLTLIRLAVRARTAKPAAPTTGNRFLDHLAPITHYGFYVLILLVIGTGLATAIQAGLYGIVFQHSGEPLPRHFIIYQPFVAHAILALALGGLVILHILAAFYHQLIRKDRLLSRMGFERSTVVRPDQAMEIQYER